MTSIAALTTYLDAVGVDWEPGVDPSEVVATLPGEHKLRTVLSMRIGRRALRVQAFVIRRPDERHEEVYRFLLGRNLRLPGLAYAVDRAGDVYLTGRLPLAAVDEDTLDELLGAVLTACDAPFDELLALGFRTAMRREWAWRRDRGESTANLKAFRHLLTGPD